MSLTVIAAMTFAGLMGAYGQVSFKIGSKRFAPSMKGIITNTQFIKGVVCYGIATLILLWMISTQDLSYVYPLVSITYVWVTLLSAMILKERIGMWKMAGITLIIAGIVLLNV